jgi:hypothetical protein
MQAVTKVRVMEYAVVRPLARWVGREYVAGGLEFGAALLGSNIGSLLAGLEKFHCLRTDGDAAYVTRLRPFDLTSARNSGD